MSPDRRVAFCEVLRSVSFFRGIAPEVMEKVCSRMVHRSIPKGFVLFRRGDPCRGVYLLTKGEVEIYRCSSDGREQVLHVERPVASVAELPIFDEGEYPASARTTQESELYFLSLDDFRRLYREHPEVAEAVIRSLGKRLRRMITVVERISLKSVPARVASLVVEQAQMSGQLQRGGNFSLKGTHEDWAHQLATTRESVARAMGGFRKKGWIQQEGRTVTLMAPTELERLATKDE